MTGGFRAFWLLINIYHIIRIPRHLDIGFGTSRQGPPHCITSIQAGSMIARNVSVLVGEFITHVDTIPTDTMNHSELNRALHGPEYTSVSLDVADLQRNAQTISVLRRPPKTSQISWARAVKPRQVAGTQREHPRSHQGRGERVCLTVNGGGRVCEALAQTKSSWASHLRHYP